jgi:hypothetical protein
MSSPGVAGVSLLPGVAGASPGVAEVIALAGAGVSFARAAGLPGGLAGITVSARTAERSAEAAPSRSGPAWFAGVRGADGEHLAGRARCGRRGPDPGVLVPGR